MATARGADAETAFEAFVAAYGDKYPKAVGCLKAARVDVCHGTPANRQDPRLRQSDHDPEPDFQARPGCSKRWADYVAMNGLNGSNRVSRSSTALKQTPESNDHRGAA